MFRASVFFAVIWMFTALFCPNAFSARKGEDSLNVRLVPTKTKKKVLNRAPKKIPLTQAPVTWGDRAPAKAESPKSEPDKTVPEEIKEYLPEISEPISMKEAVQTALQRSPTIRAARNTLESARNTQWASWYNYYFPTGDITGTSDTSRIHTQTYAQGYDRQSDALALNFNGTIPWIALTYKLTPAFVNRTYSPAYAGGYSEKRGFAADFSLPLLKGFGPMVSHIIIEQAVLDLQIAKLNKDLSTVQSINEIRTYFWDLLAAYRGVKIRKSAYKASARLLSEVRTKIKSGISPHIEIYNALSNFYTAEADLLKSFRDLASAQEKFKTLLGISEDSKKTWYEPQEENSSNLPLPQRDLEALYEQALKGRQDYLASIKNVDSAKLAKKSTANARWPDLSLTGNATQTGPYDVERTFGVKLIWYFPNVNAGRDHDNAAINLMNQELNVQKMRESIRQQVASVVRGLEAGYDRMKAARMAAEHSRKKLDAEVTRYKLGQVSQKTVTDFQKDVAQAELAELEALVSYRKSLVELDNALGVVGVE